MWNVKTQIITVIIGTIGIITKSFRTFLNNTLVQHDSKELQQTAHCTITAENDNVKL
jgi:hypothetical protein